MVALFLSGVPILDLIELKTYDLRLVSRGQLRPSAAVVLAVIDEKSLDAEGRWPWPRSKIAALVDNLSRAGARVIGFDIAFAEPDENSQLALIDQLGRRVDALAIKDPRLADFIRESRRHADHDLTLERALRSSSATVVLGYFFHMDETDLEYRIEPAEIDRQLKRISASKYPVIVYRESAAGVAPALRAYAPESNLELLTEAAASSGYFTITSDPDGVVRWMPLVIQGGEAFPAAGGPVRLALSRQASAGRQRRAPPSGERQDRRAARAHGRERPAAGQLPRPAEDLPARLDHRRAQRQDRSRDVQGPHRAGGRHGDGDP